MKRSSSVALAVTLAIVPLSSFAQSFTMDYVNNDVSGTYTYLPQGWTDPLALPSATFNGTLTGTLDYDMSNGQYLLTSEAFTLTGANGSQLAFYDAPAPLSNFPSGQACDSLGHCIDLQSINGVPTSVTVDIGNSRPSSPQTQLSIASNLSATYQWAGSNGTCANQFTYQGGNPSYNGTGVAVCNLNATSDSAGIWTDPPGSLAAPEIDPSETVTAIMLLLGTLLIVRSKKVSA